MQYIYLDVKRWEVLKLSYQIIDCTGIEGVWVYRAFQFSPASLCEGRPTPEKWVSVPCRAPPDTAHSQKKGRGGASQRELESPVYPYPFYSGTINNLV